jgi:hypothetical protein
MKKMILLLVLIFGYTLCVSAQEKAAVGLGPEWNMNSRYNFAGGTVLSFNYNLPFYFAVGFNAGASSNFTGIAVMEGAALFRWYFLRSGYTGFFAQADLGAFLIFENEEINPLFLGGLQGGYRLPFGKSFYVEPYGRLGYPFVFGIGVITGIQL